MVHCVAITTHQVVPKRQVLALTDQTVAAGRRQPLELIGLARRELNAVGHRIATIRVVGALAGFQVQQFAGDACVVDAVVVFILEFLQAAQATAIAQRLPLLLIELFEGFAYPERFDFGGHGSSIYIRWRKGRQSSARGPLGQALATVGTRALVSFQPAQ
ncbi:hypothetical protein D3C84_790570 [compost metagenome]